MHSREGTATCWVELEGCVIEVAADRPAMVAALADFYHPYYVLSDSPVPRPADVSLTLTVAGGPSVAAPLTDMRVYRSKPEHEVLVDGWRMLHRSEPALTIAIDHTGRRVRVSGCSAVEVELQARVLLRDQILQRLEHEAGWTVLHAAVVARNGRATAVLGNRGAGKTSALLTLLASGRYDFVSSDRMSLALADTGRPSCAGVPARVNVHSVSFGPNGPLAGLIKGVDRPVDDKALVDIDALTEYYGASVTPRAELTRVLLPRLAASDQPPRVRVLTDPALIRALVREHVLDAHAAANTHPRWLDVRPNRPRRTVGALDAALAAVAAHCEVTTFEGHRSDYVGWLAGSYGMSA